MRRTHDDCVDPDSVSQRTEQPAGGNRRVGGRPAGDRIPEVTGMHRNSRWDFPRKRALFTSDGSDSVTSSSDTPEDHADGPPDVEYSERLMTAKIQDEGGTERLGSPHMTLETAVIQLHKYLDDTEFEITRKLTPAVNRRPPRQVGFTSIPVPRYSGKSNWEQYREIFEAIVCSNGWDDVTAALQLLSHLDGDAINVALLILEYRRVVPGILIRSLSDRYNSPGRLAEYKRQLSGWSDDREMTETVGARPFHRWTGGSCGSGDGDRRRHDQETVADAGTAASAGGAQYVRTGTSSSNN